MSENDDQPNEFTAKIKSTLDRSTDNLDDETVRTLARIRQESLRQTRIGKRTWLIPSFVTAMASVIAIVVILQVNRGAPEKTPTTIFEDFEILSQNDELELINEVDMLQWLDDEEPAV